MTVVPTIVLEEAGPQPVVVDGPGWRQVTPAGRGDRQYFDLAMADGIWPAIEAPFTSMTSILSRGIPTDWTGPAKWNVARGTVAEWDRLAAMEPDERTRTMVDFADASLNEAADRGSAGHRALEALLLGKPVDRDDLRTHGSLGHLLAIERFLAEQEPVAEMVEAVCFDRDLMVAGTTDFVGQIAALDGLVVLDWKFRSGNSGHDRRAKEAAQVGGYAHAIGSHYFIDGRGLRRQLQPAAAGVVTFCPDGTYAVHPVDLEAAVAHYRRAVEMAGANRVAQLFSRAIASEEPDVNALAMERLARIPDGSAERARLAQLWTFAGLGAPSKGELTVEDWTRADELLAEAERPWLPFEASCVAPPALATEDQRREVVAELRALPPDLAERIRAANVPLWARFDSVTTTVEDLEDVERLIGTVAEAAAGRRVEAEAMVAMIHEDHELARRILNHLPPEPGQWTERHLAIAEALHDAVRSGALTLVGEWDLAPVESAVLGCTNKRDAVALAKQLAPDLGRPAPRKWDDLAADPLLFAAVATAA